jgi:hypothetical protein
MQFGAHLRELSRHRIGVLLSALLATIVAVASVYKVGIVPPRLHARSLAIAGASTHILVDTPYSKITDLRAGEGDFQALTTRADLLGNVMTTAPVLAYIGRRAGINPALIQASAPITADVPRVVVEPGSEQRVSALVASSDHYRIHVGANPSIPVLDVYTQAPSTAAAVRLANAAVDGLRDYLADLSGQQKIAPRDQVRLQQFGGAAGGVINHGVAIEIVALTFFTVFGISCAAVIFVGRVRRGWTLSGVTAPSQP